MSFMPDLPVGPSLNGYLLELVTGPVGHVEAVFPFYHADVVTDQRTDHAGMKILATFQKGSGHFEHGLPAHSRRRLVIYGTHIVTIVLQKSLCESIFINAAIEAIHLGSEICHKR